MENSNVRSGHKVVLGDSVELVKDVDPNTIHAVVTDPPY